MWGYAPGRSCRHLNKPIIRLHCQKPLTYRCHQDLSRLPSTAWTNQSGSGVAWLSELNEPVIIKYPARPPGVEKRPISGRQLLGSVINHSLAAFLLRASRDRLANTKGEPWRREMPYSRLAEVWEQCRRRHLACRHQPGFPTFRQWPFLYQVFALAGKQDYLLSAEVDFLCIYKMQKDCICLVHVLIYWIFLT